jgi:hypothetical protein
MKKRYDTLAQRLNNEAPVQEIFLSGQPSIQGGVQ